jgi:hypothetical protein
MACLQVASSDFGPVSAPGLVDGLEARPGPSALDHIRCKKSPSCWRCLGKLLVPRGSAIFSDPNNASLRFQGPKERHQMPEASRRRCLSVNRRVVSTEKEKPLRHDPPPLPEKERRKLTLFPLHHTLSVDPWRKRAPGRPGLDTGVEESASTAQGFNPSLSATAKPWCPIHT